jgi:hypothetical protein
METKKPTTAADLLREVGPLLFDDEDWQARAWGVDRDTVRQWQRPSSPLNRRDHAALPRLLQYAERRAEETAMAAALFRAWIGGKPHE